MANIKKALLEKMREKTIEHEIKKLEKELMNAYRQSNAKEVERISSRIIELRNKQLDNTNNKLDQKLSEREKQIDDAFAMIKDMNKDLGLNLKPNEQMYIREAMESKPLSKEEDEEVERLLQETMHQGNKGR